jgi:hypothetical protein
MVQALGTVKRASQAGNAFVFAVCGIRQFTEELHYSLRALRRVSDSRIIVVTDSTRNEQRIDWDDIIDLATPDECDDHQASIYLKTSLHRSLPTGPRYCYLDADIVALRPEVDDVFQQQVGPVTFADDHNGLSEFSPYALHCGCLERHTENRAELDRMLAAIAARSSAARPSTFKRLLTSIPYLDNEFKHVLKRLAHWTYDPVTQRWTSPEGHDVQTLRCNHLVERLRRQFGIHVNDAAWQHWNGGVFVFGPSSHQFLDAWHRKTIAIFTDPAWRTRDQGTLAATAWEFGLQYSRVLRKEFNFIVDYFQNGRLAISSDGSQITHGGSSACTSPALIHVINHFGDKTWDIWNWLNKQVENNAAAGKSTSV